MSTALAEVTGTTAEQVRARLSRPDAGRWLAQVAKVHHCSHPVRLTGSSETIDTRTGEILSSLRLGV